VDLWSRLADVRSRWNVLDHPFYRRWSAGELTRADLGVYAGQYRHAVVALAQASAHAARAAHGPEARELAEHADEEAGHVALWDDFARAVGGDPDAEPVPETRACAATWAGPDRDLLATLVALHAIESAQPAIADVKRAGLRERYGVDVTGYFDVHVERDPEHAAAARALIEPRLAGADLEAVLRANWELLDGVERLTALQRPAAGA
jgi:pyrroloquinoline quinone (PQQ) biosynthesis protein C